VAEVGDVGEVLFRLGNLEDGVDYIGAVFQIEAAVVDFSLGGGETLVTRYVSYSRATPVPRRV